MKTLIGGAVTAALGIIGMTVWWKLFLQFLVGAIPVTLILGGGLALYLGFDERAQRYLEKKGTII